MKYKKINSKIPSILIVLLVITVSAVVVTMIGVFLNVPEKSYVDSSRLSDSDNSVFSEKTLDNNWKRVTNIPHGYTIDIPYSWKVESDWPDGSSISFIVNTDSGERDRIFAGYLMVTDQTIDSIVTGSSYSSAEILSQTMTTINGNQATIIHLSSPVIGTEYFNESSLYLIPTENGLYKLSLSHDPLKYQELSRQHDSYYPTPETLRTIAESLSIYEY